MLMPMPNGSRHIAGTKFVREKNARIVTTFTRGTARAVGHSMCSECMRTVDLNDKYCRHCGARFTEDA